MSLRWRELGAAGKGQVLVCLPQLACPPTAHRHPHPTHCQSDSCPRRRGWGQRRWRCRTTSSCRRCSSSTCRWAGWGAGHSNACRVSSSAAAAATMQLLATSVQWHAGRPAGAASGTCKCAGAACCSVPLVLLAPCSCCSAAGATLQHGRCRRCAPTCHPPLRPSSPAAALVPALTLRRQRRQGPQPGVLLCAAGGLGAQPGGGGLAGQRAAVGGQNGMGCSQAAPAPAGSCSGVGAPARRASHVPAQQQQTCHLALRRGSGRRPCLPVSQVDNKAALAMVQRFVHNKREFDGSPTRDRFKLIPRIINVDEWAEKGPLSGERVGRDGGEGGVFAVSGAALLCRAGGHKGKQMLAAKAVWRPACLHPQGPPLPTASPTESSSCG